MRIRLGVVTSQEHATLIATDRTLAGEMEKHGIDAEPVVWTDTAAELGGFQALLVRTPWDYYRHPTAFADWLGRVERSRVPMWNAVATVRWNMHKAYLQELERQGVVLPGTAFVSRTPLAVDLSRLVAERGWREVIVKPAVSAGAYETHRAVVSDRAAMVRVGEAYLELVGRGDVLVQEYCPEIASSGELSFVFVGGEFSHAVKKVPKSQDFRVQEKHGGTSVRYEPRRGELEIARHVLVASEKLGHAALYARVDMVEHAGRLCLMELELIEPSLFLEYAPERMAWFAERLARGMHV